MKIKECESRFWINQFLGIVGYHKREWGCEFCLGSKWLGYGIVLFVGTTHWYQFNIYKIVK